MITFASIAAYAHLLHYELFSGWERMTELLCLKNVLCSM
uniref:Uncharacterized protein n=1 Tax=Anguilla anguilla TaxID=7936 RepID=A0A0E9XE51_ANGAN